MEITLSMKSNSKEFYVRMFLSYLISLVRCSSVRVSKSCSLPRYDCCSNVIFFLFFSFFNGFHDSHDIWSGELKWHVESENQQEHSVYFSLM